MSDKRYPTRMHEVLGVETGQVFYFETTSGLYQEYVLDAKGHLFRNHKTQRIESPRTMADIINHPERITRRPRLTEEQVAELKALLVFNKRWLTKESDPLEVVIAFSEKPSREDEGWWSDEIESNFMMTLPTGAAVNGLVSCSDPEPLDIVATLKANGVEVEG